MCIYIYIHIYIYIYMYILCIHSYPNLGMRVCVCVCKHGFRRGYMYMRMYMCLYMNMYVYECVYPHTHKFTISTSFRLSSYFICITPPMTHTHRIKHSDKRNMGPIGSAVSRASRVQAREIRCGKVKILKSQLAPLFHMPK